MSSFSFKNKNKLYKVLCYHPILGYLTLQVLIVFLIFKFQLIIHRQDIPNELKKNNFFYYSIYFSIYFPYHQE